MTEATPRIAVVVFPGSNDDRDAALALEGLGAEPVLHWHAEPELPEVGAVVLPGRLLVRRLPARRGDRPVLSSDARRGRLRRRRRLRPRDLQRLPGAVRGRPASRVCCAPTSRSRSCAGTSPLRVERNDVAFLSTLRDRPAADDPRQARRGLLLRRRRAARGSSRHGQIVLRYDSENPNGSIDDIAGVVNADGNVMGLMPHPEHAVDPLLGSADGALILQALVERARERLFAAA